MFIDQYCVQVQGTLVVEDVLRDVQRNTFVFRICDGFQSKQLDLQVWSESVSQSVGILEIASAI